MVPIHDTDVAEERWSKSGWENYELWEKVEVKERKKKRIWILMTVLLFLALSSVPILMDRFPKWKTRALSRVLAQEINQIKKDASTSRFAYRLRFMDGTRLEYAVEKISSCSTAEKGEVIRTGTLATEGDQGQYLALDQAKSQSLGVPGIIGDFCYDPLVGSFSVTQGLDTVGFGIIPVNDLTEKRLDRVTVLLLTGPSAEMSFD